VDLTEPLIFHPHFKVTEYDYSNKQTAVTLHGFEIWCLTLRDDLGQNWGYLNWWPYLTQKWKYRRW